MVKTDAPSGTSRRRRPQFITCEGGEGAGKSTQVQRLARRFMAAGLKVVVTREPGGSPRAEEIRHAILSGAVSEYGSFAEATLFAAARADHLDSTIRPALGRGALVVCDRFTDSTRVYQGRLAGVSERHLAALEAAIVGTTRPDLTLILDLPADAGLARAAARRRALGGDVDRFEREGLAYHAAVREAFLAIARADPERCAVIDASRAPDEVEAAIWAAVSARGAISSDHGTP